MVNNEKILKHHKIYWNNKVLRAVLLGIADSKSALKTLRGHQYIVQIIFDFVIESWISHINSETKGYVERNTVTFPFPRGIQINMMPFVMGDKSSLPGKYWQYWPMIMACNILSEERGKIGYLTIHESFVRKGTSQRRGGLHTETPGRFKIGDGHSQIIEWLHWGRGRYLDFGICNGGIYMASNVSDSCELWDNVIDRPEHVIGKHGDIEHLRDYIGEGRLMKRNTLYWLTDRTPHESLPLKKSCMRQYFRLVTSNVSGWFEMHSTPNPLGVMPACEIIKIDKFALDSNSGNCTNSCLSDTYGQLFMGKIHFLIGAALAITLLVIFSIEAK